MRLMRAVNRILPKAWRQDLPPIIPVVRLNGPIGMVTPLRPGLSLAAVAGLLERAFSFKDAPAVAVVINSPGGSPVQSTLIYKRIRALAEEKKKPVTVYVEDVAASGGYMLACAGDDIVADPSSIVGSIGVIFVGFGFDRAIEKLGIDRRVYTAGTRKMTLDPFQPEKPEEVKRIRALQREMHQSFIDLVKERRGDVLTEEDKALFTGEFWTGTKALTLGLVDRLGDLRSDMRARFGDKVTFKVIAPRRSLFGMRQAGAWRGEAPSLVSADDWIGALETRELWQRYGF